ncbi:MAG: STAS domain-containing protein [Chloroflexi bacterium]|nr:STAS domain-containing protein [Chloroflexota bacterium]
MRILQQELQQNTWLVTVQGRLDQTLNPALESQLTTLLQQESTRLIVDLEDVSYINSGGLRCLVSAWRKARLQDGNLVLCSLNTRLQEIFSMVGFDKVFKIYSSSETAQQALSE